MKKQLHSLAREISVCCGTSCSKQESICALNELVSEISFFKERYDLMKKTLTEICYEAESSIKAIEGNLLISEKEATLILPLLNEIKNKGDKILLVDINAELIKSKNKTKENQLSP